MPTLGYDSKPAFGYHAFGGLSEPNQEAEVITLPAQRIRITKLAGWLGGWSGTCRMRLTMWDDDTEAVLAQTAEFVVANEGAPAEDVNTLYAVDLSAPYETPTPGMVVKVGFTRHRDDAHITNTGSTVTQHYHGRGAYPGGTFGDVQTYAAQSRRIGVYIADYQIMGSAWVYRSGAWVRSDAVKVYRSGSWVDADAVKVYRSGAWVDAD
jgi:hypothetical protein